MANRNGAELESPWTDLPPKIIAKIVKLLDSGVDVCRLHSVCKNWHSPRNPNHISLLSPFLPLIISNASFPFTNRSHEPIILVARAVFLVKPLYSPPTSCGWFLTVEEVVPGKLRILYPLSTNRVNHLPSNCPKYLDLSKFRVSQVAKSYVFKYESDGEDVPGVTRVVCCSGYTAMVLYGEGTLIGLSLKTGNWSFVRESIITFKFSDVISYGGNHVRAVDCKGNFYVIDHSSAKVVKSIFLSPVSFDRINLFQVNSELFAAAYLQDSYFRIYRLDEVQSEWIDVGSNTICSKVFFLSSEWSFFLYTCDLDLCNHSPKPNAKQTIQFGCCKQKDAINGDYVIYSSKSFRYYPGCYRIRLIERASLDLDLGVCFLNFEDSRFRKRSLCSTATDVLWPPPTWFWPDIDLSTRDDEELDIYCQNYSRSRKKEVLDLSTAGPSTRVAVLIKQGAASSFVPTTQKLGLNHSTVVFEGLGIKSNLVPTLQKVWAKYGNILEGCMIRNTDMLTKALESLATALIILETSSGRSLNKTQADYLSSVLYDLQHMNFKVYWLVSFVENALTAYKSKPLIDSLKDFSQAKAQVAEMKLKLLDELATLDEVEDMAIVSERLTVLESMDFDKSLGEGLY